MQDALPESATDSAPKNLFIVYIPGLGGNHLANILSLSDKYATRFDPNSYNDQLFGNTHSTLTTDVKLKINSIKTNLETLKKQNNIFCGHLYMYHQIMCLEKNLIADNFPNRSYLVLQMPKVNTRAYRRILSWSVIQNQDEKISELPSMVADVSLMYYPNHVKTILNEDADFYGINPDLLFADNIGFLLIALRKRFGITIDRVLAQELQTKWLNSLTIEGHI